VTVDFAKLQEIFLAAVERHRPEDWDAYVNQACAGDDDLRRQVNLLLQAHREAGSVPGAAASEPDETGAYQTAAETPGVLIGPYKLIEPIGEGGMGTVWMAQQTEPVKRLVAVKLIKAGMDSKAVIARFEAERQALALMDHANIARVLDAGTTKGEPGGVSPGRPYFVMDLVKGVPITRYCDEHHLTPKQRLELFIPVCQAVQHAHQKGIIHRDLKPSNVLVALYDGKPVPKVIDFGVAKAAGQSLTDKTLVTGFGNIVGTLEYMSPEQAEINQLDIDTRSDIYSLGVLLYELLTGSPPFTKKDLEKAGMLEMLRVIREQEPSKPSTKLSTADGLPTLAANRGTEPAKLTRLVRGELDWIVMKALEKDRNRRYETANGFAMDVQRYLADEPVLACPPSASYRLRKFARKHRTALATVAAFMLVLIAATAVSIGLAVWAERERLRAVKAENRAGERESQAIDAVKRFRDAVANEPELMNSPQLEVLRKKLLKEPLAFFRALRESLQADGDTGPEALARLAQASFDLGSLTDLIGDREDALTAHREALAIRQQLADANPAVTQLQSDLAHSHNHVGVLLRATGKPAEALKAYESALAIQQKLADTNPTVTQFQSDVAANHHNLGNLLSATGKPAEALKAYESALAIDEKLAKANPTVTQFQSDLAASHNALGLLLADLGKRTEAEEESRKALVIREKLAAAFPTVPHYRHSLANSHNSLGTLLEELGKRAAAEEQHRKALAIQEKLAADFPTVTDYRDYLATSHHNLGILLAGLGKSAEAKERNRRALAIFEKLAADFPAVPKYRSELAASHNALGLLLADLGKRTEAEEQSRKALAIQEKLAADFPTVPKYRSELALSHDNLGNMLAGLGKRAEAEQQYGKALAIREKLAADLPTVPEYRLSLAGSHQNLGNLLAGLGKGAEAEERHRRALAIFEKLAADFPAVPKYRSDLAASHSDLGNLLADLGKRAGAEDQNGKALAIREKLAADFPTVPTYRVNLGGSYCNLGNLVSGGGKPADSLAWYQKALDTLRPVHEQEPRDTTAKLFLRNSHWNRAVARNSLGQFAEALKDWDRAIELSEKSEQPHLRVGRAITQVRAGQVAEAVAEVAALMRTPVADAPGSPTWNAGQWYDLACFYSLASGKSADRKREYADRAMELLRKAANAGYNDAGHMKQDSDLDPLRSREDFKLLLREIEAKKSAPKTG
jgi:serine/threonine protein kinase